MNCKVQEIRDASELDCLFQDIPSLCSQLFDIVNNRKDMTIALFKQCYNYLSLNEIKYIVQSKGVSKYDIPYLMLLFLAQRYIIIKSDVIKVFPYLFDDFVTISRYIQKVSPAFANTHLVSHNYSHKIVQILGIYIKASTNAVDLEFLKGFFKIGGSHHIFHRIFASLFNKDLILDSRLIGAYKASLALAIHNFHTVKFSANYDYVFRRIMIFIYSNSPLEFINFRYEKLSPWIESQAKCKLPPPIEWSNVSTHNDFMCYFMTLITAEVEKLEDLNLSILPYLFVDKIADFLIPNTYNRNRNEEIYYINKILDSKVDIDILSIDEPKLDRVLLSYSHDFMVYRKLLSDMVLNLLKEFSLLKNVYRNRVPLFIKADILSEDVISREYCTAFNLYDTKDLPKVEALKQADTDADIASGELSNDDFITPNVSLSEYNVTLGKKEETINTSELKIEELGATGLAPEVVPGTSTPKPQPYTGTIKKLSANVEKQPGKSKSSEKQISVDALAKALLSADLGKSKQTSSSTKAKSLIRKMDVETIEIEDEPLQAPKPKIEKREAKSFSIEEMLKQYKEDAAKRKKEAESGEWPLDSYGDHSIHNTGAEYMTLGMCSNGVITNIFSVLREFVCGTNDYISWHQHQTYYGWTLRSIMYMPLIHGIESSTVMAEDTHVFVARNATPLPFTIYKAESAITGNRNRFPAELCNGANLDARKVANAVSAIEARMDRNFAQNVANLLLLNTEIVELLSLFTRIKIIEYMLADFERAGIEPQYAQPIDGDVTTVNWNPAQAVDPWPRIQNAMAQGHYLLLNRTLNTSLVRAMRLLAIGPSGINTPDRVNFVHIGSNITHNETFRFMLVGDSMDNVAIPADANATAAEMAALAIYLAKEFGREDDFVDGCLRASLILTGKIKVVGDREHRAYQFITATCEIGATDLPASRGPNIFWKIIQEECEFNSRPVWKAEALAIGAMHYEDFNKVRILASILCSLGFSHFFHSNNITGLDMGHYLCQDTRGGRVTTFLDNVYRANTRYSVPIIFQTACRYIGEIYPIAVNGRAYRCSHYMSRANEQFAGDPNRSHWFIYKKSIPYVWQPFVLMRLGIKLDSKWGISMPGVSVNFLDEIVGIRNHNMAWRSFKGCSLYSEAAASNAPYRYVPYGGLVLNAIAQEVRINAPVFIKFDVLAASSAGGIVTDPLTIQPGIVLSSHDRIHTIIVGRIITYDWENDVVLAPALEENIPEQDYWREFLIAGEIKLTYAGLTSQVVKAILPPSFDLDSMFNPLDPKEKKGPTDSRTAPTPPQVKLPDPAPQNVPRPNSHADPAQAAEAAPSVMQEN